MARDGAPAKGKYQRRPPSEAEQERRKAWGAKYGPLVGESVKKAIREAEG